MKVQPPIVVAETIEVEKYHPPFPKPMVTADIEFVVLTSDTVQKLRPDYVYMGLSWEDYLTFARYMQDIKHKLSEYVNLVCYYRDPGDDELCVKSSETLP
jgi:hypothetical protein